MNLAKAYSRALLKALNNADTEAHSQIMDTFIALVKKKGHGKLLHAIMEELKTEGDRGDKKIAKLSIASSGDEKRARELLARQTALVDSDLTVAVDDTLIGGYVYDNGNVIIDTSYKKQLLNLYRSLVA